MSGGGGGSGEVEHHAFHPLFLPSEKFAVATLEEPFVYFSR